MKKILRIATRKSPLALWQANFIAQQIQFYSPTVEIELIPLTTSGDRFLKNALITEGGKGLFVKELEEALIDDRADIAVHSVKDVPSELPEGLILGALYKRESPFDVLISQDRKALAQLPINATIGTVSLRRQGQLLAYRSDFKMLPLRGNINTRIAQLEQGHYDAIILAEAALTRMNLQHLISERLTPPHMYPACGQGTLGIECRQTDEHTLSLISPLHDKDTAICVLTERRVNALLGGNCHVPLAVYCKMDTAQQLTLHTKVMSSDGQIILSEERSGPVHLAAALADESVAALIAQGAEKLLSPQNDTDMP